MSGLLVGREISDGIPMHKRAGTKITARHTSTWFLSSESDTNDVGTGEKEKEVEGVKGGRGGGTGGSGASFPRPHFRDEEDRARYASGQAERGRNGGRQCETTACLGGIH